MNLYIYIYIYTFLWNKYSFPLAGAAEAIKALMGPKYDGKYLHKLLKEKLGDRRLRQTLTNVVIPTFDIKRLQPTIFSSYEVCLFPLSAYNKTKSHMT